MANKLEIKSLGVLSVAKLQAVVGLVMGLIIGVIYFIIAVFSALLSGSRGGGAFLYGVIVLIAAPVLYAIFGFIGGAVFSFVYNLVAGYVGGIEIEVENSY
jgi:hypothetical protein